MANDHAPSAKTKFPVKGKVGGTPGDLGLADSGPAGATYPAPNLTADGKSPSSEYSKAAMSFPNPTGRLVIPEGS